MVDILQYDLCPETGIGCVMVGKDESLVKIDLMPDEAADLQDLVKSGDLEGAKALLVEIDQRADDAIDNDALQALEKEIWLTP